MVVVVPGEPETTVVVPNGDALTCFIGSAGVVDCDCSCVSVETVFD